MLMGLDCEECRNKHTFGCTERKTYRQADTQIDTKNINARKGGGKICLLFCNFEISGFHDPFVRSSWGV